MQESISFGLTVIGWGSLIVISGGVLLERFIAIYFAIKNHPSPRRQMNGKTNISPTFIQVKI